ncbi:hypothetical protein JTB14_007325 [Gonioctena quinquepunctata]|nr:hypothetical protein JTB14_007325 [Gonioctena quinquepunctata]
MTPYTEELTLEKGQKEKNYEKTEEGQQRMKRLIPQRNDVEENHIENIQAEVEDNESSDTEIEKIPEIIRRYGNRSKRRVDNFSMGIGKTIRMGNVIIKMKKYSELVMTT